MDNREINLNDLISVAIKRLWILVVAAIVGAALGNYYSKCMVTPKYQVKATFLVDTSALSESESAVDQIEAQRQVVGSRYQVPSYVQILDTADFADAVLNRLEENKDEYPLTYTYSTNALRNSMTFSYEEDEEFYKLSVTAYSPEDALNIARCIEDYSEEYIVTHKKMAVDTLRIIDHARPSNSPINVNTALSTIIGAFFVLAVAFAACFIIEMRDVRIKSAAGITEILGIPVIGAIPEVSHSASSGGKQSKKKRKKDASDTLNERD